MSQQAFETSRLLRDNIERVVLGKPEVVRLVVVSLLAGEHVLLEDVPGVGKTLMGKALARVPNRRAGFRKETGISTAAAACAGRPPARERTACRG